MSHRILVVDDEPGVREALKQLLEYEGYAVSLAASGHEALDSYAEAHPHLVLLDVKMAGMDGLSTLTKLREADPHRRSRRRARARRRRPRRGGDRCGSTRSPR